MTITSLKPGKTTALEQGKPIALRLTPEARQRMNLAAHKTGHTPTSLARFFVMNGLDEFEKKNPLPTAN